MLDVVQGTPEWQALRLGKVTASRIADVMAKGKSGEPSATRASYLAQLVAERLTGRSAERGFKSPAMEHGTETEGEACAAYAFLADARVESVGFIPHPSIEWAGASPDRLVNDDGLVEIKCPNTATHIATLMGAPIARGYILQMQWQLACTGRQWCDFMSYDPAMPHEMREHIRRVDRDDALIADVEAKVAEFLAEVDATITALRARFGA